MFETDKIIVFKMNAKIPIFKFMSFFDHHSLASLIINN